MHIRILKINETNSCVIWVCYCFCTRQWLLTLCINCHLSLYLIEHLTIKTWRWEALISFRLLTHYQYPRVCRYLPEFACLNVFWVYKADLNFLRCVSVLWVYVTSWTFRGSIPAQGQQVFLFSTNDQTGSGTHPPPVQWVSGGGVFFLGGKAAWAWS